MVKCLDFFGAALFLKLGHSLGDIQDIIHFMPMYVLPAAGHLILFQRKCLMYRE
mgnify:CR=1 FL=1